MPEIQLPDLVGTGEGLMSGTGLGGEFLDMPEMPARVGVLGGDQTVGCDLMGTFYDFKRNRKGKFNGVSEDDRSFIPIWLGCVNKLITSGFNPATLSRYYQSTRRLYASCLVVSPIRQPAATELIRPPGC